jgi:hypothetical protein
MGNKERYINFIVDNLVKRTEIDYDKEVISFPFTWGAKELYPFNAFKPYRYINPEPGSESVPPFDRYCRDTYGVKDEELQNIWGRYMKILKPLIVK